MGKGKQRQKTKHREGMPLFDIDCRSVGCGGTTVSFYQTAKGIEAVWQNENCPYGESDERGAAKDGHNVSILHFLPDQKEALIKAIQELP